VVFVVDLLPALGKPRLERQVLAEAKQRIEGEVGELRVALPSPWLMRDGSSEVGSGVVGPGAQRLGPPASGENAAEGE
jgi:hypothetical protein